LGGADGGSDGEGGEQKSLHGEVGAVGSWQQHSCGAASVPSTVRSAGHAQLT
jgi:hypothetical protein